MAGLGKGAAERCSGADQACHLAHEPMVGGFDPKPRSRRMQLMDARVDCPMVSRNCQRSRDHHISGFCTAAVDPGHPAWEHGTR